MKHPAQRLFERIARKSRQSLIKAPAIALQFHDLVGAHEARVDIDRDLVTRDRRHDRQDVLNAVGPPGGDIDDLRRLVCRDQARIDIGDHANVGIVALGLDIAERYPRRAFRIMGDDLRNEEALGLTDAGIVERPGHDDRQPRRPDARQMLDAEFRYAVIVRGHEWCRLGDRPCRRIAIDIGTADGFYSFLCESRGAKKVVAVDWLEFPGFTAAHKILNSNVEFRKLVVDESNFGFTDLKSKTNFFFAISISLNTVFPFKKIQYIPFL